MFALIASPLACAQTTPTADYRHYLQRGVDAGIYDEVAAGWIDGGEHQTWLFGRSEKPSIGTPFEIGAATEIFTGLLLAQAAFEGKVRLQTTLHEVLPANFPLADPALGALTLRSLATHNASLPALPPNLLPARLDDPYADFSTRDLYAFLANYRRTDATVAPAYSALDAGLLAQALALRYGQKYTELLDEKILQPLGMQDTTFEDSLTLPPGHSHGATVAHWHYGAVAGAAGLRASVRDLLSFLQQNLQPQASKVRAAILLARQAQNGGKQDVGLGWYIVEVNEGEQSWPLVWRASTTAGFATFLGFRTDRQQALVLLGNSDADLSALGIAWLEQRSAPPLPVLPPPQPQPPAAALQAYAGLYQVHDGAELIVRANERGLSAQIRGQPAQTLRAAGDDTFAGETYELAFQHDGGKVSSVVINFGGVHVQAQRLSERAPEVRRPAISAEPRSFGELAGDYRVDADTLLRIRPGSDALWMQLTGRAALPLIAFGKDHYGDTENSCELTFTRNAEGIVNGLVLSLAGIDRRAPRVIWSAPAMN